MSRTLNLLKVLIRGAVIVVISILFFPFVVPGMLLSKYVKSPHERWVIPVAALLINVVWRMICGTWVVDIGGDTQGEWMVESLELVVSWAFGVIFVRAGFQMPRYFMEGFALQPVAR
jgi:hypothetical protein